MRPLLGREKLALQSVFPDMDLNAQFTQRLQGDLAGNAFNSADFVVAFLALVHVLSHAAGFQNILGVVDTLPAAMPLWLVQRMQAERERVAGKSRSASGSAVESTDSLTI